MYCDIPLLGRCCFCMPLRRGVLTFGYLNIVFSALMIGLYSFFFIDDGPNIYPQFVYHGAMSNVPLEFSIAMYCLEIVANVVMLYGAHKKIILYMKIYYFYTLGTLLATLLLQIITWSNTTTSHRIVALAAFFFSGMFLQLYLVILVKSLIKKLEVSVLHTFDNQLQEILSGERKMETNEVNDNTVVPQTCSAFVEGKAV